jgi:hypothetical protein
MLPPEAFEQPALTISASQVERRRASPSSNEMARFMGKVLARAFPVPGNAVVP